MKLNREQNSKFSLFVSMDIHVVYIHPFVKILRYIWQPYLANQFHFLKNHRDLEIIRPRIHDILLCAYHDRIVFVFVAFNYLPWQQ
jgi:hypothetical protein